MGQYNGKWPISLVYMSKPLITVITAIGHCQLFGLTGINRRWNCWVYFQPTVACLYLLPWIQGRGSGGRNRRLPSRRCLHVRDGFLGLLVFAFTQQVPLIFILVFVFFLARAGRGGLVTTTSGCAAGLTRGISLHKVHDRIMASLLNEIIFWVLQT